MKIHTRAKRELRRGTHLRGSKRSGLSHKSGKPNKRFMTKEAMLSWLERNHAEEYEIFELDNKFSHNFRAVINKQKPI